MKKSEKLFREIGEVNEELVEESADKVSTKTKKSWIKLTIPFGACAAAIAGLIVWRSGVFAGKSNFINYDRLPFEYSANEELQPIDTELLNNGMGFEGYMAYDISELTEDKRDWISEYNITELPVFSYKERKVPVMGTSAALPEDEMFRRAIFFADSFDKEITELEVSFAICGTEESMSEQEALEHITALAEKAGLSGIPINLSIENLTGMPPEMGGTSLDNKITEIDFIVDDLEVWVYGDGMTRLSFEPSLALPEEYDLTGVHQDKEKMDKVIAYLAETYGELLGFNNAEYLTRGGDRSFDGSVSYGSKIYDNSDDPFTAFLNYQFKTATFGISEGDEIYTEGVFVIWVNDCLPAFDCTGIYPAISAEKAREMLLAGDYVTTVPLEYLPEGKITEDMIKYVNLTYHENSNSTNMVPYYKFLVELTMPETVDMAEGLKNYGAFYVPAVESEYIAEIDTELRFN